MWFSVGEKIPLAPTFRQPPVPTSANEQLS
jgi:hypothetical protein